MSKRTNIVFSFFAGLVILAWGSIAFQSSATAKEYQSLIDQAFLYEEKQIYIDALATYNRLIELNPKDYQLWMHYAEVNKKLANEADFLKACLQASELDPSAAEPYLVQAEYFLERNKVSAAISILKQAEKVDNKTEIIALLEQLKGKHANLYLSYSEVGDWHNGYAPVKKGEEWGLISSEGQVVIVPQFLTIGVYDREEGVIPVQAEGEWIYVNQLGQRKLVSENRFEYLGTFSEGVAPAKYKGKYGLIDRDFTKINFDYNYISTVKNGVAVAKNSSGKWALIDKRTKAITEFIYDDAIIDKNGFCSTFHGVFLKYNDRYLLVDLKGNPVTAAIFDHAKPFSSDGYAAVKIDGRWGFIDKKGSIVIKPQYDDVGSFSLGLAPVRMNEEWGYIDVHNQIVIEPTFKNAKSFSENGVAAVQYEEKNWQLIQLYEYKD